MPKFKSLLISVKVQKAKRSRKCQHNKGEHSIAPGERCLAVQDAYGGFRSYCIECATKMLDLTTGELRELVLEIEANTLSLGGV